MGKKILLLVLSFFVFMVLLSCKGDIGDPGPAGVSGKSIIMMSFQEGVYPSDGYTGTIDTDIIHAQPEVNNGACDTFDASNDKCSWNPSRGLLRFDLTPLVPANVTVVKAYLELHAIDGAGPVGFVVHELTKEFEEGGNCNLSGAASWVSATATTMWTTPGGDYNPAPMSSVVSDSINPITIELNPSVVQKWINSPSKNYGMMIKASPETGVDECRGAEFASSENSTLSYRPKLTIYYTLP